MSGFKFYGSIDYLRQWKHIVEIIGAKAGDITVERGRATFSAMLNPKQIEELNAMWRDENWNWYISFLHVDLKNVVYRGNTKYY